MTGEAVRPFPLVPQRRFVGVRFGRGRSARRGQGDEVAGTRPYRPGDRHVVDRLAGVGAAVGGQRRRRVRRRASSSPTGAAGRARLSTGGRGWGCYGPDLPWLTRPRAVDAVTALIAASAIGERGELAYVGLHVGRTHVAEALTERTSGRARADGSPDAYDGPVDSLASSLRARCVRHRTAASRPARSSSSSRTSSAPFPLPSGRGCARCAWDVTPVVVQDPTWEQTFPDVARCPPAGCRSRDRRRCATSGCSGGDASGRTQRGAAGGDARRASGGSASIPCVLGSERPGGDRGAFGRWAERRRRAPAARRMKGRRRAARSRRR